MTTMRRGSIAGADALDAAPGNVQPGPPAEGAAAVLADPAAPAPGRRRRGVPAEQNGAALTATAGETPSRRLQAARAVAAVPAPARSDGPQRDTVAPGRRLQGAGGAQTPRPAGPGRDVTVAGAGQPARRKHAGRPVIDLDELWAPVKPDRAAVDREFLPGALEILEAPASPIRVWLIYALCGLVTAALAWSWFGHLDVYADATGKVQASGRTKVVQPVESGRVEEIQATDGDHVKAGAVLVRLDPTSAIADRNVTRDQLWNARGEVIRHQAEIGALASEKVNTAPKVEWPSDLPGYVTARETQALTGELSSIAATLASLQAERVATVADRDKYQANIEPQKKVIALVTEHLGMGNQLYKDGYNSRLTVITEEQQLQTAQLQLVNLQGSLAQAEAAIPVIDAKILSTRQTFVTTNTTALVQSQQQVDKLRQDLAKADEKVDHMTLTSPIDGTVQATAVTTVGQVVTTGQQLMQVVPEGTPLEVDAYILNSDAGFVRVGQDATIKVDTFPYTRYGTISGKVTKVAADALPGKQAQQQQGNGSTPPSADGSMSVTSAAQQVTDLVFPVTVVPDQPGLMVDGRLRKLTSGMTVTVEIRTESRRAIDYILSPLHSLFEQSAQER
ncbi:HlyD family type I secretion periplasmic adaptor subunit [Lichenibacterium minor]|uniref:Membrane fusion protein (MFP) family protein n=1 Tax=Lichenibacterium minor TaxID=2316528 RepID=A0A4Q2UC86_9HYPH|nr:HlyD family type I secretion periplasmic adaptor subunit [Lichenibacterium minor]RYC33688.1 HlyD family type I secretion periplasmic adaptor subunit [Lichenibacterium minor]